MSIVVHFWCTLPSSSLLRGRRSWMTQCRVYGRCQRSVQWSRLLHRRRVVVISCRASSRRMVNAYLNGNVAKKVNDKPQLDRVLLPCTVEKALVLVLFYSDETIAKRRHSGTDDVLFRIKCTLLSGARTKKKEMRRWKHWSGNGKVKTSDL